MSKRSIDVRFALVGANHLPLVGANRLTPVGAMARSLVGARVVKDCCGNHWYFATHVEDVPDAELQRRFETRRTDER